MKTFATLSMLASALLVSQATAKSSDNKVKCNKILEGPVVLGTSGQSNPSQNLHVHNSSPATNGNAMLGKADKETWAAYWSCTGFDGHNNTSPSKNTYFGQLRVADTWCYTLEPGTHGVQNGLVLEECAWDASEELSKQWIHGSWQDDFFEITPTVTDKSGSSKLYSHVAVHDDFHDTLDFSGKKPTKQTVAIKYQ